MVIQKKHAILLLALVICALVLATMARDRPVSVPADAQQIDFLTTFYKSYLSALNTGQAFRLPSDAFYSTETQALLDENSRLCRTLSRGDDICGYGADGDVFLDTQEMSPTLNFETSRFTAVRAGNNTVDVGFSVWPEYGAEAQRSVRYVLVKEGSGWRVADALTVHEGGHFSVGESLRHLVADENARIRADAADLAEVLNWMFVYLREPDMAERFERFVAFPVMICHRSERCQSVPKGDARMGELFTELHRAYYKGDKDITTDWRDRFPTLAPENLVEGRVVQFDALELTFHGNAWWLTRVNLK